MTLLAANRAVLVRRYRMIGEVMRHELPESIDTGFHHGVMQKIRQEAQAPAAAPAGAAKQATPVAVTARSWFRPFAGLAGWMKADIED